MKIANQALRDKLLAAIEKKAVERVVSTVGSKVGVNLSKELVARGITLATETVLRAEVAAVEKATAAAVEKAASGAGKGFLGAILGGIATVFTMEGTLNAGGDQIDYDIEEGINLARSSRKQFPALLKQAGIPFTENDEVGWDVDVAALPDDQYERLREEVSRFGGDSNAQDRIMREIEAERATKR
jgi:hypothetical protein